MEESAREQAEEEHEGLAVAVDCVGGRRCANERTEAMLLSLLMLRTEATLLAAQ